MSKILTLFFLLFVSSLCTIDIRAQSLQQDTTTAAQLLQQNAPNAYAQAINIYAKWKLEAKIHQTKMAWVLQLLDVETPEQIEQAEILCHELLTTAEKQPAFTPNQGELFTTLGIIYRFKNNATQSEEYLQKAMLFFDKIHGKDAPSHIKVYQNLGRTYLYEKAAAQAAIEYFSKALALHIQHHGNDNKAIAQLYCDLATGYRFIKDGQKALENFKKAFEMLDKYPDPELLLIAYSNTGTVYTNEGNLDRAVELFEKAIAVQKKHNLPFSRRILPPFINLADMYRIRKQSAEAMRQFKEVLPLVERYFGKKSPKVADIYNKMCVTFFGLNELDSVMVYAQRCVNTCIPDFNNPDIHANPTVTASFRTIDDLNLLMALINKTIAANDYYKAGKGDQYLDFAYQTAISSFDVFQYLEDKFTESRDKLYLMDLLRVFFEHAIFAAITQFEKTGDLSYWQYGMNVLEYSKSLLLRKSLQKEESQYFGNVPDSLMQQEKELKRQIAAYEKKLSVAERGKQEQDILTFKANIFDTKDSLKRFQQRVEQQFPQYHQLKSNQNTARIAAIQSSLPADAALISYFCYQPDLYSFVITKDSAWGLRMTAPAFEPKVDSLLPMLSDIQSLQNQPDSFIRRYSQLAHPLYGWLIDSLHLPPHVRHLIISPDHHLHFLPFESLLRTPAQGMEFARFDYLLRHYAVTYTYSATLLLQLQEMADQNSKHTNNKMLAMAASYPKIVRDSTYLKRTGRTNRTFRDKLDDLPGAKQEVEQMQTRYNGTFLMDTAANERNFKQIAENYGVLHFAMHGVMNEKTPSNSGLVFTETMDTSEDDMLHAYEINNLSLHAQLVVLSACETGHGKFESGEGVMSIARSFMYAGVASVIATLWQVNDVSTAKIMNHFYTHLHEGTNKAEALRQAKLTYLETAQGVSAHPAFWAAPVQIGDYRPLQFPQSKASWWLWTVGIGSVALLTGYLLWSRRRNTKERAA